MGRNIGASDGDCGSDEGGELPAVRLSDNFKLPSAVLFLGEYSAGRRSPSTPEIESIAAGIVGRFYHDISQDAAVRIHNGDEVAMVEDPEGPTVLVGSSATSDRIRADADEGFRAAYGDQVYMHYLMSGVLEARSSAGTGSTTTAE